MLNGRENEKTTVMQYNQKTGKKYRQNDVLISDLTQTLGIRVFQFLNGVRVFG